MQRITKSLLLKIDPSKETRDRDISDAELRGFGVRVRPKTDPTFYFRYQSPRTNKIRMLSLGSVRAIELERAREIAREYRGHLVAGTDPADAKRSVVGTTFRELYEKYLREYAGKRNKPRTIADVKYLIERFVLPTWGTIPVSALKRGDAFSLIGDIESRTLANRTRSYLSKLFNLAELWELRPDGSNPIRHVPKYPENRRERALLPQELRRLWEALEAHDEKDHPTVVLAKLILLTGARRGELEKARLEDVDWALGILKLPDSKTGKGELELTDPAISVIKTARRASGCPYVIPGYSGRGPIKSPWGAFRRILGTAGISDLRLHDLRHAFGTYAHHAGATQRQIMDLLRHTTYTTSERYVHGFKAARKEASEKTVRSMLRIISGGASKPEVA